jgi:putative transposase
MDLRKQFNAIWRQQFPWVGETHRDCHSQPFMNLDRAFQALFKKTAGYPKFKKRGQHDSFYLANDKFKTDGKAVRIPVIGWVRTREPLRFVGKVMGATVHRIADAWYISVQVDVGDYHCERTGDGVVGADVGLTTLATLSTGEKIEGPKALAKAQKHLRRLHKSMDRKQKGSANRRKVVMRLARAYARVTNIRSDALHKLTTRLCRENQAVGIEDLNVRGMLRNHKVARGIVDASWGEFRRMLAYKAPIFGTDLRVADRWCPSSKTCSGCGAVKASLGLGERTLSVKRAACRLTAT